MIENKRNRREQNDFNMNLYERMKNIATTITTNSSAAAAAVGQCVHRNI